MARKFLIIRLGSLGDVVLTSSTVINLKIEYPDSHITYFCKDKYRSAVELIDGVDDIVCLPEKPSLLTFYKLLLELDKRSFDYVIDLHGNFRSWLARKTITADDTVVYPKRRYDRLVTVRKKMIPKYWPHTIDLYNEAIRGVGAAAHCRRPTVPIPADRLNDRINTFLERNRQFAVIAPGAAHANKQWPIERFVRVASMLHADENLAIIWAITSEDKDNPSPEDSIGVEACLRLVDCPIAELAAIMSKARITIANDSGITHLSSAVGTPAVAVFGPTHPALGFAPNGLYDRVVEVDEYCRPCSLHGKKLCFRDQRYCFDRIDATAVFCAASDILQMRRRQSRAVFVDRDGTIIVDKNFLSDPEQVEFENSSAEAMKILSQAGFRVVIISNQSGVARGFFGIDSVERVNARLMEMLAARHVEVDGVYYCPHLPEGNVNTFSVPCRCRKPSAGMTEDASYQLSLDLRKSYVIGDKIDDVNLAKVIGADAIMVRTGYGSQQDRIISGRSFYRDVFVAENLLDAARRIISCKDDG
ncbi:MAG: HAD-IIIA family hydrolase [Candidatus Zixiibacteriota bacterium]|nr:MAG: HAD-IIIA family hydrolase [candidate division Zixibacteria bacterium]